MGALAAFSTPADDVAERRYTLPAAATAKLRIYNQTGQLISTQALTRGVGAGSQTVLQLPTKQLHDGVYPCQLRSAAGRQSLRLLVQH
ncbi:T9SS type A sorting domain-containing protein [Hymenobacter sp. 15J16-1T3B]|uniref:T9SS type A sorting domain-containing protein n=1 Tax=Hymenobacter sp. 15J16-1T3B TaxID=2886941 RepID=UPI001D101979|nr:T9SS type A sorting domain-containing protein [Hymenobacter sp. 15J16-1T3B]MCC3159728.1 T9SS type A sorting domain-containing protein [Hymenobacter sp. 15J16-1T3B]